MHNVSRWFALAGLALLLGVGALVVPALAQTACDPSLNYLSVGSNQYQAGDFAGAVASFTCAIEQHPNSAMTYNGRGNAYRNSGSTDLAIADYSKAIELEADYAIVYNNRGYVYYQTKQLDKALADLNKAIELDAALAYAYNNRGLVYQLQGKYDLAIADFNKAIELGHDPLSWPEYNLKQATFERDKLANGGSSTTTDTANLSAGELFNRAYDAALEGNYTQAVSDYTAVLELEPDNRDAWYNRGDANFNLGNYDAAIADFSKTVELDPEYYQAYHYRGVSYERLQRYADALNDYDQALEIAPDYLISHFGRGNAYRYLGQYQSAIDAFTHVLDIDPSYVGAYHNRGLSYAALNNYQAAIDDYTKTMELDPSYNFLTYDRGNAYLRLEDWDNANSDFTAALELDAANSSAYLGRGIAQIGLGDRQIAAVDFVEYFKLIQTSAVDNQPITFGQTTFMDLFEGRVFRIPFSGEAGQKVSFSAASDTADSLLVILGPDNTPLMADDDDGDGLNALIVDYELPANGSYTLMLGHAGGEPDGSVTLVYGQAIVTDNGTVVLSIDQLLESADNHRINGEYELAVADYTQAIELGSRSADVYFNRGYSYGEIGEYEKAIADNRLAIEYGYTPIEWPHYNIGWNYEQLGEYEQAITAYDKAIELNPSYALAYYGRGYAYDALEQDEQAIADYTKSLELGYTDPASVYADRGSAYLDLGQYDLALEDFNYAVEVYPDDPGGYLSRGIAFDELGELENAAADYMQWIGAQAQSTFEVEPPQPGESLTLDMKEGAVYRIQFDGEAGQLVTVRAISAPINLLVVDPLVVILNTDLDPLAGDDDGGKATGALYDSLIDGFELPADGTYTLIVSHAGANAEGKVIVLLDVQTQE